MRVLVLADAHHDFWAETPKDLARFEAGLDAMGPVDAAILAGDMANKARTRWAPLAAALDRVVARSNTYVFPGNHDYYGHRIDGDDRLAEWATALGWNWAQQRAVVLGGARFLCATLWTNMSLDRDPRTNGATLAAKMNDYRFIRVARGGYRKLRPEDTVRVHDLHLGWLSQQLDTPFDGPTAVVTHHVPHHGALGYVDGVHDAAYASDLHRFLDLHQGPHTRSWFFGHAHASKPFDLPGWSLRPHSLGYPFETGEEPAVVFPRCVVDTTTL